MDFIANGEIAVLHRMRRTRELYGFPFCGSSAHFS